MAKTISISNQRIENRGSPKRNNVYTTSAKIYYTCSAGWSGSDTTSDPGVSSTATGTSYTSYWNEYSTTFTYIWTIGSGTFYGKDTTATITGLTKGAQNSISGSVTVKGSYIPKSQAYARSWIDTSYYSPIPDANGKKPGEEGYSGSLIPDGYYTTWSKDGGVQSGTDQEVSATRACTPINVWTRPGTFTEYNNFSGGPTGTIIQSSSGLTVSKVANWCTHCNKFAHWYNQNSTDTAGSSCQATVNGLITAEWYNACVDACADATKRPAKVTGGPTGTIMTPSVFSNLGEAISKEDF